MSDKTELFVLSEKEYDCCAVYGCAGSESEYCTCSCHTDMLNN